MTVAQETPFKQITADGATLVFAGNFTILSEDDLAVYEDDVLVTSGFTVSGVGTPLGATITYTTEPADGTVITLLRQMDPLRETDYQHSGDFRAPTVNTDFDRIWYYLQQIQRELDLRVLRFGDTESRSSSLNLIPTPIVSQLLQWQADGSLGSVDVTSIGSDLSFADAEIVYASMASAIAANDNVNSILVRSFYATAGNGRASFYNTGSGYTQTDTSTLATILSDLQSGYFVNASGIRYSFEPHQRLTFFAFGAHDDESTDDYAVITAALAYMSLIGGGTIHGFKHVVSATVVIPNLVTVDLHGGSLIPSSDINVLSIRPGGLFTNSSYDYRAATLGFSFTSQAITLSPTTNTQGRLYQKWLENIVGIHDVGAYGEGVTIDASTYYVMEMRAANVAIWRGNKAVNLIAGLGVWITHCTFANFNLTDNIYHVYTEEDVSGNTFVGGATEKNTYGQFHISGGGNKFLMTIQDGPDITIARDSNDGCDSNYFCQVSGVDLITLMDGGSNTRIIGRGYEYFDGRVITGYRSDKRANVRSGGEDEFIDMMMFAPDPRWTQAVTGTGAITSGSAEFGIASGFEQNATYTQLTLAADNDTAKLDSNGIKPWATGKRPTLHVTTGEASTYALVEIGFYADANNYILIKFDGTGTGGATGSGNWSVETCVGGTSTSQVMTGSAGANRINLFTLRITDTSIKIWYGEWNINNSGSSGQLSKWAQIIESVDPDYEITTNIPEEVAMEQRIYAEADGGAASVKIFDIQYLGTYKEFR